MPYEHDPSSSDSEERKPRKGVVTAIATSVLALGTGGAAIIFKNKDSDARSKDRVTLTTQPFKKPSIVKVETIGETKVLEQERDQLKLTLTLPKNPETVELRRKYSSNDLRKSIGWLVPYNIHTAEIKNADSSSTASDSGNYVPVLDGDIAVNPKDNHATIEIAPLRSHKDGTDIAIFTEVEALHIQGDQIKYTNGYQYIGAIVLGNGQWQIDKSQQPLPDFSYTEAISLDQ